MIPRWKRAGRLLPTVLIFGASWTAFAQDARPNPGSSEQALAPQSGGTGLPSQPPTTASPQLSLEVADPPVLPTMQSPGGPTRNWDRQAVARLRNPFGGEPVEKRGLLEGMTSRPSPQYPGLAPEAVGPGLVPAPGAGQMAEPGTSMPGGTGIPGAGGAAGPGAQPGPSAPAIGAAAAAPLAADAFGAAAGPAGPGFGGGAGAVAESFPMIGDRGPLFLRQNLRFPPIPTPLPPGVPSGGNNPATLIGRSVAAIVPGDPRHQDRGQPVPTARRPRLGELQLLRRRELGHQRRAPRPDQGHAGLQ